MVDVALAIGHQAAGIGAVAREREAVEVHIPEGSRVAGIGKETSIRDLASRNVEVPDGVALAVEGALKLMAGSVACRAIGTCSLVHVDVGTQSHPLASITAATGHTLSKCRELVGRLYHIGVGLGAAASPVKHTFLREGNHARGIFNLRRLVGIGTQLLVAHVEDAPVAQVDLGIGGSALDTGVDIAGALGPVGREAHEVATREGAVDELRRNLNSLVGIDIGIHGHRGAAEVHDRDLVVARLLDIDGIGLDRVGRRLVHIGHHCIGGHQVGALESTESAALVLTRNQEEAPAAQVNVALGVDSTLQGVGGAVGLLVPVDGTNVDRPVGGMIVHLLHSNSHCRGGIGHRHLVGPHIEAVELRRAALLRGDNGVHEISQLVNAVGIVVVLGIEQSLASRQAAGRGPRATVLHIGHLAAAFGPHPALQFPRIGPGAASRPFNLLARIVGGSCYRVLRPAGYRQHAEHNTENQVYFFHAKTN